MSDESSDAAHVHVHVHLVMAGAFPLRMADLLFTDDELLIPEYHYLTPLLGIARRETHQVAERAVDRYTEDGAAGLVEMAERTHSIGYADLERVRVYDGGPVGRPKLGIDVVEGPPYAYRAHVPVDVPALTDALGSLGRRRGFAVERKDTLGFDPVASLRRFVVDR
ncbi:hypothetical protein [Haloarchaeobius sp. HRN-SO-5]|uniref:hypothetical protein n=1 Tax=Haloarchaeobius sp. HRN-SO-5 TaxID=3446118 RepID=UPI003EB6D3DF